MEWILAIVILFYWLFSVSFLGNYTDAKKVWGLVLILLTGWIVLPAFLGEALGKFLREKTLNIKQDIDKE